MCVCLIVKLTGVKHFFKEFFKPFFFFFEGIIYYAIASNYHYNTLRPPNRTNGKTVRSEKVIKEGKVIGLYMSVCVCVCLPGQRKESFSVLRPTDGSCKPNGTDP